MSRVFWDTNLFIYLIEGTGDRSRQVLELYGRMRERGDSLFTSALTVGEVLVKPVERNNDALRRRYEQALGSGATVLPFDIDAASHYAEIRQDRSIRPPDAIQLACAAAAEIDLFITNDDRLTRKSVRGIQFIQPLGNAFI
ncbi:MAG: type II toxin-antitoxin system VapC family toxin [Acidobacteriia bacterium]|nr:type II toxin-antitoxin system VapC family toxin [Terriglobia bacterium]MYC65877.1 type II toxin-antitoxin system VapC family toxin [Terriglobia bacterium]